MFSLITILGPTACGKTALACELAWRTGGEIISADSRQVYRGMDIGTGKDLADYTAHGTPIPYHLIDIREAGDKYNLYEYQHDFHAAYTDIRERGRLPILCGGTGLYIESVLSGYRLLHVPENPGLRARLAGKSLAELTDLLASYKTLHNTTDVDTPARAIRAIEIAEYQQVQQPDATGFAPLHSLVVGIDIDREERRRRITARLQSRLREGMVDEVRCLLERGIPPDDLIYYGLEYKYVTLYLTGALAYDDMYRQLEIAIHQFAKRQMTWFRGMDRRGIPIRWLPCSLPDEAKVERILEWGQEQESRK